MSFLPFTVIMLFFSSTHTHTHTQTPSPAAHFLSRAWGRSRVKVGWQRRGGRGGGKRGPRQGEEDGRRAGRSSRRMRTCLPSTWVQTRRERGRAAGACVCVKGRTSGGCSSHCVGLCMCVHIQHDPNAVELETSAEWVTNNMMKNTKKRRLADWGNPAEIGACAISLGPREIAPPQTPTACWRLCVRRTSSF